MAKRRSAAPAVLSRFESRRSVMAVIGRLFGDGARRARAIRFIPAPVTRMNSGRGTHLLDVRATGVAHARSALRRSTELMTLIQRTFVRNTTLDTFRYEFFPASLVRRPGNSGHWNPGCACMAPRRAHAAVRLVGAPLVDFDLTGRLVGSGQQATNHDGVRRRRQGLWRCRRSKRRPPSAIRGTSVSCQCSGNVG